ncbi:MAG: bifunctional glutamate N-acetyltransferase/amino-acid acetyltransferase ArgJ [Desulfatirhabdiaceae bacterium]
MMMESMGCKGFRAAGIAAGIKKNGKRDLGLIVSDVPATAAGVFTKNRVKAAPVVLDMERIGSGKGQAILVNSGCANCCTGKQGFQDAMTATGDVAHGLNISPDLVLAASTGVIGQPLPMEKLRAALPDLLVSLSSDGFPGLSEAIMTTDTVPKLVSRQFNQKGKSFTITGTAKGAGMICPNMATLLCFLCTDIQISADRLHQALLYGTEHSFNRITIDGDTSTNDTALILANGLSGASVRTDADFMEFQDALAGVMVDLAKMLVKDGEGATKLVEVVVKGANSDTDARKIADTIANSALVKTAIFGEDANWGRILAAAGRSGIDVDPDRIDIYFNDVLMFTDGRGQGKDVEDQATRILKLPEYVLTVNLNQGSGRSSVWTCDFSVNYVKINADYRS